MSSALRIPYVLVWMFIVGMFGGCVKKATSDAGVVPEYEVFTLASRDNCQSDTLHCSKVELAYPLLQSDNGYPKSAANQVNGQISQLVRDQLGMFSDTPNQVALDTLVQWFHDDYAESVRELGDYAMSWTIEVEGEVLYLDAIYLSVALNSYAYTGGAHPNSYTSLNSFFVATGDTINLKDKIVDLPAFLSIAEDHFRRSRQLSPTESLGEAGYFWGESFSLPENMSITESGIQFLYNPYEIAAYVLGSTAFIIPYADLVNVLDDQLLQHFLKQ